MEKEKETDQHFSIMNVGIMVNDVLQYNQVCLMHSHSIVMSTEVSLVPMLFTNLAVYIPE